MVEGGVHVSLTNFGPSLVFTRGFAQWGVAEQLQREKGSLNTMA